MGPSVEGLAATFREYVGTNPEEFSTHAHALIEKPAIFVRGFISQMSEALKAGNEVDLTAIFSLCEWVVKRPIDERTTPEQDDEVMIDKNWQWTRDGISELLGNVFKATSAGAPRYPLNSIKQRAWDLIETLYHDPPDSYIASAVSS